MEIHDYAEDQTEYLETYGFDKTTILVARYEGEKLNIGLQEISQL